MRVLVSATGSTVKLWNFNRTLLKEFEFPETIKSLAFFNGNILVGHNDKLTVVEKSKFVNSIHEESEVDEEEIMITEETIFENNKVAARAPISDEESKIDLEEPLIDSDTWNKAMEAYYRVGIPKSALANSPQKAKAKKKKTKKAKKKTLEKIDSKDSLRSDYMKVISRPVVPPVANSFDEYPNIVTRRQLTEQRIINNIRNHGAPGDDLQTTGLAINTKMTRIKKYK